MDPKILQFLESSNEANQHIGIALSVQSKLTAADIIQALLNSANGWTVHRRELKYSYIVRIKKTILGRIVVYKCRWKKAIEERAQSSHLTIQIFTVDHTQTILEHPFYKKVTTFDDTIASKITNTLIEHTFLKEYE